MLTHNFMDSPEMAQKWLQEHGQYVDAKGCVMSGETWTIKNPEQRKALIAFINENAHSEVTFTITRGQRTSKQNNALHAYLRDVSEQMCARGLDMREGAQTYR